MRDEQQRGSSSHYSHDSRSILRHRGASGGAGSLARAGRARTGRHDVPHAFLRYDTRRRRAPAGGLARTGRRAPTNTTLASVAWRRRY